MEQKEIPLKKRTKKERVLWGRKIGFNLKAENPVKLINSQPIMAIHKFFISTPVGVPLQTKKGIGEKRRKKSPSGRINLKIFKGLGFLKG